LLRRMTKLLRGIALTFRDLACIFPSHGTASLRRHDEEKPMESATQPVRPVAIEQMQSIYDEVKTPHKYGIIIKGEPGKDGKQKLVDCPSVFRFGDKWYMLYVCMNDVGYETHLAD